MAIDRDEFYDAVSEIIFEQSVTVLGLGREGDRPGGSGAHQIKEWNGLYFFTSTDQEEEGPFPSIEEALRLEYFNTRAPQSELWSDVLSESKLREVARHIVAEEGDEVRINKQVWVLRNGVLC